MAYRSIDCPNCNRLRVWDDGICEKCHWDVDANTYASISRPEGMYDGHWVGVEIAAKARLLDETYLSPLR